MHKVTLTMMFVTILFSMGTYQVVVAADMPHVFSLNPKGLVHVKDSITANNHEFDAALTTLYKKAKSALKANRFSVVDKPMTPPSGDKHDFLSLARYWWPNPDTPDGLPY